MRSGNCARPATIPADTFRLELAVAELHRQRIAQALLNHALERPRAELRIILKAAGGLNNQAAKARSRSASRNRQGPLGG